MGDFYRVLETFNVPYLSVIFASPILNMFVISLILSYVIPDKKETTPVRENVTTEIENKE